MHSAGDYRSTVLAGEVLPVLTCSLVYACVCVRLSFLDSGFLCSEHTPDTQGTLKGTLKEHSREHTPDTQGNTHRTLKGTHRGHTEDTQRTHKGTHTGHSKDTHRGHTQRTHTEDSSSPVFKNYQCASSPLSKRFPRQSYKCC